jgi:hypothetical protein
METITHNHEGSVNEPVTKEQDILVAAIKYIKAGISVIPIKADTKEPPVRWTEYQNRLATTTEASKWWMTPKWSIAIVCGTVSQNLEVIDFDEKYNLDPEPIFDRWHAMVDLECPGLVDRLVKQKSRNNGEHLVYRCAVVEGNMKLASRFATEEELKARPKEKSKTLIETRGTGGYFLCYPSPGYTVVNGSLLDTPEITPSEREIVLSCARSLNLYVEKSDVMKYKVPGKSGNRPGDVFNKDGDHRKLLESHGWAYVSTYNDIERWRKPGEVKGTSASYLVKSGLFWVWSTNAGLQVAAYDKFALYANLETDGDYVKAARSLAEQGFGELFVSVTDAQFQIAEEHLKKNYDFRINIVTDRVEFRSKDEKEFSVMTDFEMNSIERELRKEKSQIGIDALYRLLYSDFTKRYDPFKQYFESLARWDGQTDYIGELAESVSLEHIEEKAVFAEALRKFLIGLVACAIDEGAVNQAAIILVGKQGLGKSRWLNNLVPKDLGNYTFVGTIDPNNKDTLIHLSECLLINLDELETLKKPEIGALKTIMTLPSIRMRRPYGRIAENFIRRASFVGSINQTEFLNDPTGSRRFLTFEVKSVEVDRAPNMDLVMAQAYRMYTA